VEALMQALDDAAALRRWRVGMEVRADPVPAPARAVQPSAPPQRRACVLERLAG
jgi:hypothetical protein